MSIVIPTHNRLSSLKRLIHSLNQLRNSPEEVIIINDGSQDDTQEYLYSWAEKDHPYIAINYINKRAQGPGAARNIGIRLASSPFIAFTDDDCIVHKAWVQEITNSSQWNGHKNIVGIGGKVLPFRKGLIGEYFTFHRILEPPDPISYLVTANACYQKEVLLEVNGFDVNYRFPGGEDCGLSLKLVRRGYQFGYESKMVVWHDYRTSLIEFMRTFYRYGKGCAETVSNHFHTEMKA